MHVEGNLSETQLELEKKKPLPVNLQRVLIVSVFWCTVERVRVSELRICCGFVEVAVVCDGEAW